MIWETGQGQVQALHIDLGMWGREGSGETKVCPGVGQLYIGVRWGWKVLFCPREGIRFYSLVG